MEAAVTPPRQTHHTDFFQKPKLASWPGSPQLAVLADWITTLLRILGKQESQEGHVWIFATTMLTGTSTHPYLHHLQVNITHSISDEGHFLVCS